MARSTGQKMKLLYLAEIFTQKTDEAHALSIEALIDELARRGVSAERKAIYEDLEALREIGMDIIHRQDGRRHVYYLGARTFELPELKILADCVVSARFISERKSQELIRKLASLTSTYEAGQLKRQLLVSGRIRTMNQSILISVDKIHSAIAGNRQVTFRYFRRGMRRQKIYGHGGNFYTVSPWHLLFEDENYYLIAWDQAAGGIRHYRVDRMERLDLTDLPREGTEQMQQIEPTVYTTQTFSMYGGESRQVTLEADAEMAGVIFDRFGLQIPVIQQDDTHFLTTVDVAVSPQFLGWIAGLGGQVRITGPADVVAQMRQLVDTLSAQYP